MINNYKRLGELSLQKKPSLYDFAYINNMDEQMKNLASLAMYEDWDYKNTINSRKYPILFNYLHHTFEKLQCEKKISISSDNEYTCFNTGLVTDNQEDIYALFTKHKDKNSQTPWFFIKFCKESDRDLLCFSKLPDIAHYFDEPTNLLYDTRLELRVNYDHILDDNQCRFPEPYSNTADSRTKGLLRNALSGATENAKKRIRRNYKTAIPQFYQNKLQLLLPLSLNSDNTTDLALVIERENNVYRANTCLTLDMAYNNARLLARPDSEWLKP